ncbi:gliding motility-like protein [Sporocytophaga myxococcoides]|uniref:Gliding motility-like protein n=1 Tax=Sporocytophaga myxococcoides TaxID=153721 RepID=A0A098L9U0_9BACT|nr:gliding motility protein GldM [Sporocytophaga myxococcoides]GAL83710.1 gliding motility-like protein [Sporocytophaga myxococcoides]
MAGGKETPRQKMIGMMYLVLTALLALQVSSAIIQKFKFLDDSLMNVNEKTAAENAKVSSNIRRIVEQEGNKDAHIVKKADEVKAATAELIAYMEGLRKHLIDDTGGKEEDGNYKGAKEEEKVANFMVGPEGSKKGEAYKLKEKLNNYAASLSKFGVNAPKLALDGKEDPMFMKDKEQARKDFAQLNFSETPMVAALAVLAQKEAEVLKYENEALAKLASEVGASDIKFDNVVAMVRPASKVVAAGTKYEAEMFLAASSSAITPTMSQDGRAIQVDARKIGKVSFTATAGAYDSEGNAKKKWKGAINFKYKGKDTTFVVEEDYIVAKPVIQIQSASVSALYKNCGNELNVQVPALGSTYSPSFTASGAKVIPGATKGLVTLVPTGAKVTLNVASSGNAIGSQEFNVRLIPKPEIQALSNGSPVNEKQGVPAPGPRAITMKAVPDESFKTFLPKDARYKITQWDAILVRGKRPVTQTSFTSETGNLAQFAAAAQPGDRIMIEVKKVTRTNFLNESEEVNLGIVIKNIPLN